MSSYWRLINGATSQLPGAAQDTNAGLWCWPLEVGQGPEAFHWLRCQGRERRALNWPYAPVLGGLRHQTRDGQREFDFR